MTIHFDCNNLIEEFVVKCNTVSQGIVNDLMRSFKINKLATKLLSEFNSTLSSFFDTVKGKQIEKINDGKIENLNEKIAELSRELQDPESLVAPILQQIKHLQELSSLSADIESCTKTILLTPSEKELQKRSQLYAQIQNFDAAIKDCDQLIKLNEENPDFYLKRADAYTQGKKYAEAIKDCEKCIKLGGNVVEARNCLGLILQASGKYKEALNQYSMAIKIQEKDPQAWVNRGKLYLSLGMMTNALRDLFQAVLLGKWEFLHDPIIGRKCLFRLFSQSQNLSGYGLIDSDLEKVVFDALVGCSKNNFHYNLSGNNFTDKGIDLLIQLVEINPFITELKCDQNSISSEKMLLLQQRLSENKIQYEKRKKEFDTGFDKAWLDALEKMMVQKKEIEQRLEKISKQLTQDQMDKDEESLKWNGQLLELQTKISVVENNLGKEFERLSKRAAEGDLKALFHLGLYLQQDGEHQNEIAARTYIEEAAKKGYHEAQYHLGCVRFADNNLVEALAFWTEAAKKGSKKAIKELIVHFPQRYDTFLSFFTDMSGTQVDEQRLKEIRKLCEDTHEETLFNQFEIVLERKYGSKEDRSRYKLLNDPLFLSFVKDITAKLADTTVKDPKVKLLQFNKTVRTTLSQFINKSEYGADEIANMNEAILTALYFINVRAFDSLRNEIIKIKNAIHHEIQDVKIRLIQEKNRDCRLELQEYLEELTCSYPILIEFLHGLISAINGKLLDKDKQEKMINLLKDLAIKGEDDDTKALAYYELGRADENGERGFEFFKTAGNLGYLEAQRYLYLYFHDNNDQNNALIWLKKMTEQRDPEALWKMACYYRDKGNIDAAFPMIKLAAENFHPLAKYELAFCYKRGIGISKDNANAFNWMLNAATDYMIPVEKASEALYETIEFYRQGHRYTTRYRSRKIPSPIYGQGQSS